MTTDKTTHAQHEVREAHLAMEIALEAYLDSCRRSRHQLAQFVAAAGGKRAAARKLGITEGTVRALLRKKTPHITGDPRTIPQV